MWSCHPHTVLARQLVAPFGEYVFAAHALQVPATVRDASPTARFPVVPPTCMPHKVLSEVSNSLANYNCTRSERYNSVQAETIHRYTFSITSTLSTFKYTAIRTTHFIKMSTFKKDKTTMQHAGENIKKV